MNTIALTRRLFTSPLLHGISGGVRLNATHNYVYMINKRHFWKLNKQTLSSPPPPDPPQPQETQGEQPTQSETQTVQPAPSETQSAPVQQPQTQNKVQHNKKNKNKQQTVPNPIIHTPIISPLHNLPPDGIVFKHEQKWFVRFFGKILFHCQQKAVIHVC